MNLPIDFEVHPLVPAVVQDDASRAVLMVGFMNRLAFETTLETGFVHFWSRSRNTLWKKGETSGHTQEVVSMAVNCEDNSLLIQVVQTGAVCHTGHRTCYYRQILPDGLLFETSDPVFDPATIYLSEAHSAVEGETSLFGLWFGAYRYLGREPLQDVSRTSKLLHDNVLPVERIADELEELRGALLGEHRHSDDVVSDVTLEGSQVLYWLNVLAIGLGEQLDGDPALQRFFAPGHQVEGHDPDANVRELRESALAWRASEARMQELPSGKLHGIVEQLFATYLLVARAVAPIVEPSRLVERDLRELRSRPYLEAYFSQSSD